MRCSKILLKSSHRNCNTSISKSPCWNTFHIYVLLAFNLSLSLAFAAAADFPEDQ